MPSEENFGEQFGFSEREQSEAAGRALADHFLDALAKMQGFHDYEHAVLTHRRAEDEQFIKKYQTTNPFHGAAGAVKYDPDYDTHTYEIKHPSGWKGVHRGMMMDLVHPKHGAVDVVNYTDFSRHGIFSPPTHEDWPDPHTLHSDLDEFVREQGQDYDW